MVPSGWTTLAKFDEISNFERTEGANRKKH